MDIAINGININYTRKGSGQVMLLLHGWGAYIELFSGIIDLVSSKYDAIALDMPGFGHTSEPSHPWCVDDYVDLVIRFIDELHLDNIILLGHSFGSRIIIKMMSREEHKFNVDKIIIVDGAGIRPEKSKKAKMRSLIYKIGKTFYSLKIVRLISPKGLDEWRKKFGSADYNSATPVMRDTLVKVVNEDLTHLLPNVTTETLLIWGENDTATPLSDGKKMEELMPNAGLAVIKNAGHYSFLEQQYVFNRILSNYLSL